MTAGLIWAPEIGPKAYTALATTNVNARLTPRGPSIGGRDDRAPDADEDQQERPDELSRHARRCKEYFMTSCYALRPGRRPVSQPRVLVDVVARILFVVYYNLSHSAPRTGD